MAIRYKLNGRVSGDHVTTIDGVPVNLGTKKLKQVRTENGYERTVEVLPASQAQLKKLWEQGPKLANGEPLIVAIEEDSSSTKK